MTFSPMMTLSPSMLVSASQPNELTRSQPLAAPRVADYLRPTVPCVGESLLIAVRIAAVPVAGSANRFS